MDITIRQLEIFRAVVLAGSVTRGAKAVGLSQPSISQQLARLEKTLRVTLLVRDRKGQVTLTPAGEFWFKSSEDLVDRMARATAEHQERFHQAVPVLRLGTTPALRGRFTSAAARIAAEDGDFGKFELIYDRTSTGLAQQLRTHGINMAILVESAIGGEQGSFVQSRLFDDAMTWAVPIGVTDDEIRAALTPGTDTRRIHPALRRYVDISGNESTRRSIEDWYRHHLPGALPMFGAPTFVTSIELVAEGLTTSHMLRSLWPNLPQTVRERIRLFSVEGLARPVVLAMRRHLLTHPAFARCFHALTAFCRTEYQAEMDQMTPRPLSDLMAGVTAPPGN